MALNDFLRRGIVATSLATIALNLPGCATQQRVQNLPLAWMTEQEMRKGEVSMSVPLEIIGGTLAVGGLVGHAHRAAMLGRAMVSAGRAIDHASKEQPYNPNEMLVAQWHCTYAMNAWMDDSPQNDSVSGPEELYNIKETFQTPEPIVFGINVLKVRKIEKYEPGYPRFVLRGNKGIVSEGEPTFVPIDNPRARQTHPFSEMAFYTIDPGTLSPGKYTGKFYAGPNKVIGTEKITVLP
jgi:hypothetical protein